MAYRYHTVIGLTALALMTSCAGTTNEIVPTGHDTYMIANHGTMSWSSAGAQKAKAFEQANAFCKSKAKEVETINERETDSGFGKIASAEIEFRCVAPGKTQSP
jgi:hypothetical protein